MVFGVLEELKKGQEILINSQNELIKGQNEMKEILKRIEQKL